MMNFRFKHWATLSAVLVASNAFAKQPAIGDSVQTIEPGAGEFIGRNITIQETALSQGLFYLFVFSLISMNFLIYLNKGKGLSIEIIKYFCIILIILSSLFLVAAGYGDKQIAPIVGLLGTIVGFLLGNSKSAKISNE